MQSDEVSAHLQTVIPLCDLVVGTEEEIHIAGGSTDTIAALRRLRELTPGTLVVKRGPMGCVVFPGGDSGRASRTGSTGPGFPVDVYNILGAGDAFMAGFLRGWIRDEAAGTLLRLRQRVRRAGRVAARLRAGDAELDRAATRSSSTARRRAGCAKTRSWNDCIATRRARATGATWPCSRSIIARSSSTWPRRMARGRPDRRLQETDRGRRAAGCRRVERRRRHPRRSLRRGDISRRHRMRLVGRAAGRAARFAAADVRGGQCAGHAPAHVARRTRRQVPGLHHPDDPPDLREQQLERLRELQAACIATFREFLIEVIPPADMPSDATTVARALEQIYAADVVPDWWKLPPSTQRGVLGRDHAGHPRATIPHCRGVLLLGLEASEEDLQRGFNVAARFPLVKGFAVGRSIFADMAAAWFAGDARGRRSDRRRGAALRAVDRACGRKRARPPRPRSRPHERAIDAAREHEAKWIAAQRQDGAKSVSPPTSVG